MTIIQNSHTLQFTIGTENSISLRSDELKNKKINSLCLFTFNVFNPPTSPFNDVALDTLGIENISGLPLDENYFISLIDNKNILFTDNLKINQNASFEGLSDYKYTVNRFIDWDKSTIRIPVKADATDRNFLLVAFYQTKNFEIFNDQINGSFQKEIPFTSTNQDIRLRDFLPPYIQTKKVKKIQVFQEYFEMPNCYLDIITTDGKRFYNLPCALLQGMLSLSLWFDNIKIDLDNSFIRQRGAISYNDGFNDIPTPTTITFLF